jgi:hypothetical protein
MAFSTWACVMGIVVGGEEGTCGGGVQMMGTWRTKNGLYVATVQGLYIMWQNMHSEHGLRY